MLKGTCGVKFLSVGGREFICVKPVHAKIYRRHKKGDKRGDEIFENNPGADRHYFVRHYPYVGSTH